MCSNVGTRTSSSGSFGSFSLSSVLRIGVGDGQVNSDDWALLMPLSGNGNGDYSGYSAWAFGGEGETNNGYSGTVAISATCAGRSFTHHCLRALSPDVRTSVRVRHDGPARGAIFVDFFVSLDGGALYYVCWFVYCLNGNSLGQPERFACNTVEVMLKVVRFTTRLSQSWLRCAHQVPAWQVHHDTRL